MPAKKKGTRGKTVDINDFNEDYIPEDNLDWAVEAPQAEKTELPVASEKPTRREFSRVAGNALAEKDGFRDAPVAETGSPKRSVDELQPPYVAHFGNLRNGTSEAEFLRHFNEEAVVKSRLINQEGKSFAFVEFNTPHALAIALQMNHTTVRGRKMYVDLATQRQIERLYGHSGLSRPGASQAPHALHALNLTRDTFGTAQNERGAGGTRSGFGSRGEHHAVGELSRDMMGTACTSEGTPSPKGPPDFARWRSEGPVSLQDGAQSQGENNRSGMSSGFRSSKAQSPIGLCGLANWRDEPVKKLQPQTNSTGAASPTENGEGGRKGFWGKGSGSRGTGRQAQAPRDDCKWDNLRR